jgi:hypothetical protein
MLKRPGTASKVCQSSNTLQQVHRCLLQTEQVALVRCSCLLLSAGCCVVAAAQGLCTTGTCKACLIANTRASMHTAWYAGAFNMRLVQAVDACGLGTVCATWQHTKYRLQGMSDRIDTRTGMHIYIRVFCSSHCAVAAVCNLFCYCRMQGFVQHETRYSLQGPLYRRNTFK